MKKKKEEMTFEILAPFDIIVDEKTLKKAFKKNFMKAAKKLHKWEEKRK